MTVLITVKIHLQDILTDLSAESELIPLQNIDHNWKGHKVSFSHNVSVAFHRIQLIFIPFLGAKSIPPTLRMHFLHSFQSIPHINKLLINPVEL